MGQKMWFAVCTSQETEGPEIWNASDREVEAEWNFQDYQDGDGQGTPGYVCRCYSERWAVRMELWRDWYLGSNFQYSEFVADLGWHDRFFVIYD